MSRESGVISLLRTKIGANFTLICVLSIRLARIDHYATRCPGTLDDLTFERVAREAATMNRLRRFAIYSSKLARRRRIDYSRTETNVRLRETSTSVIENAREEKTRGEENEKKNESPWNNMEKSRLGKSKCARQEGRMMVL